MWEEEERNGRAKLGWCDLLEVQDGWSVRIARGTRKRKTKGYCSSRDFPPSVPVGNWRYGWEGWQDG